jgi:hypothetical protein
MSWEAVGAVAELLGAAGVIASLLYLAVQIRSSTAATKAAAGEAATRSFREVLTPVYSDPKLAQLFGDLHANFGSLKGVERHQAVQLMFQCWKAAESIHYHYARGMLDPMTWASWESLFVNYINTPGFHAYWELRRTVYTAEFQAWVADNMEHMEGRTAANL